MKISNNVIVIEFHDKFITAYRETRKRKTHKLVRFAAVIILACYIYDCLEETFKKG